MNVGFLAILRDESAGELVDARVDNLKPLVAFAEQLFERFYFLLKIVKTSHLNFWLFSIAFFSQLCGHWTRIFECTKGSRVAATTSSQLDFLFPRFLSELRVKSRAIFLNLSEVRLDGEAGCRCGTTVRMTQSLDRAECLKFPNWPPKIVSTFKIFRL